MKTRIFTLLVAFLTMVGNAVWGQETTTTPETETIDGKTFYLLGTKEDLKWFQEHVSESEDNASACAKLTDNIDLGNEEWEPIMYKETASTGISVNVKYTGTFDGNGKTIKGLYIKKEISGLDPSTILEVLSSLYNGLFGVVGDLNATAFPSDGEVKNLTVEGKMECSTPVMGMGGICGLNKGTIQNCINKITLVGTGSTKGATSTNYIGGICNLNQGIINNCTNEGSITTSVYAAGGIGVIEKCYNKGAITESESGLAALGGICGVIAGDENENKDFKINNCFNTGVLTANEGRASGICNLTTDAIKTIVLTNCHNYGNIKGQSEKKAGICVFNNSNYAIDEEKTTISNNYYLESTVETGWLYSYEASVTPNDQPGQVEAKSEDAFANGEVLYLLQQNNAGVWEQTIGTDDYPVFEATSTPSTVYQVTFDYNYEGSPEAIIYYVEESESVTVPTMTREGYTFTNWSTDAAGENVVEISGSITPDASVTYYAQWQAEQTEEPGDDDDNPGGIVPDAPKYYNIYEEEICEGVTVEFSRDVVKEGQSVLVTVKVDEEFDATKMTLKFKRSLFGY